MYNTQYNQFLDGKDGSETQAHPMESRWVKGAVIGGVALFLVAIVATATWAPAYSMNAESTSLIGLAPMRQVATPALRLGGGSGAAMVATAQRNLNMYGIRSSPLENFALSSIAANNLGNQMRGVSVQAQVDASGWATVDQDTKRKLVNVLEQVEAKESVLAGITAPMGFFDPIGFSTTVTGGKLLFYREVELKHGRVAMLAALGMLVGEQFHPLFGGDIDVPAAFAFQQTPLETFWPAVVTAIAVPEIFSVFTFQDPSKGETWSMKADHVPGDLGFDPLGLKPQDPQAFKEMQTKELNNGRLAMIAAAGMIAQEIATGHTLF